MAAVAPLPEAGACSMSAIAAFDFGGVEVRTVIIDDEPWFVLADICRVLGLSSPTMVASRIHEADLSQTEVSSGGQRRLVTIVNESGMYEVVIRSDKPEAAKFRRWVTSDVLPSIRKTGSYSVAEKSPMEIIADQHKAVAFLLEENTRMTAAVHALTPRADAWDDLASAEGDMNVSEASKILTRAGINTGPRRLFDSLDSIGWVFKRGGKWHARQTAVDNGYLTEKLAPYTHPNTGERMIGDPQIRVTVRGLERLRVRLGTLEVAPTLRAVNS